MSASLQQQTLLANTGPLHSELRTPFPQTPAPYGVPYPKKHTLPEFHPFPFLPTTTKGWERNLILTDFQETGAHLLFSTDL